MKEHIRDILLKAGAVAVGFSKVDEMDPEAHEAMIKWIGEGCHGDMKYLERHLPLKKNPSCVLKEAKTVISLAFSYAPEEWLPLNSPMIASYAYFQDYHYTLPEILRPIIESFKQIYGGTWRLCIDTAPLAERYHAFKSGIAKRGLNGSAIVEGCGGLCFLAEIVTTLAMEPDKPDNGTCRGCRQCMSVCPGKAIKGDGTIDARKCINYLTIEKDGDFSEEEIKILSQGSGYIYGCDKCLRVCPHNKSISESAENRLPKLDKVRNLKPEDIISMDDIEFSTGFSDSPIIYSGYSKLVRNALLVLSKNSKES